MPKTTSKRKTSVTVNIKPGELAEVSPAQRQAYKHFWTALISQVGDELKVEGEAKR
ncbi:hypothetical protein ACFLYL_02230 [Chloroflexota bacterium]